MNKKLKKIGKYIRYLILLVTGFLMFIDVVAIENFFEKFIGYDFDTYIYLMGFIISVIIILMYIGPDDNSNGSKGNEGIYETWMSMHGLGKK